MARTLSPLLVSLAFFAPSAVAWVTYDINCTAPTEADNVNFVSSSNVRSTLDIVWASLSILLLTTWNALHLSVPSHFDVKEKGWKGLVKEHWRGIREKGTWMFVMVISPEYLFGKGMMENFAAKHSVGQFKDERWTTTHAYFANMRGLILRFQTKSAKHKDGMRPTATGKGSDLGLEVTKFSKDDEVPYEEQDAERAKKIELQHCRENCHPRPRLEGERVKVEQTEGNSDDKPQTQDTKAVVATVEAVSPRSSTEIAPEPLEKPDTLPEHDAWEGTWALDASQWYEAYQLGIIQTPPQVTLEAIQDRSKGDGLAKGLAILQISWLVIQVIARAVEHLAITLLEVTVLAFAATAIAIYITIWSKPQAVKVPIFIDADRLVTREDVIKLAARSPKSSMVVHEFWLHGVCIRSMADNVFPYAPGVPIPWTKDDTGRYKHRISAVALGIGLGGAIFGAVHCVAWNFRFPTSVERILWQVSCIFIVASPMPCAFFYLFTQQRAKRGGMTEAWTRKLLLLPLLLLIPVYMFFRLYLMVEACRSLAYPEASTFQDVQWPSFIPHFG